jgi:magnesium transporter
MADINTEQPSTQNRLEMLSEALASGAAGRVRRLVHNLHPAEIGDLLESLPQGPRVILWELVDGRPW